MKKFVKKSKYFMPNNLTFFNFSPKQPGVGPIAMFFLLYLYILEVNSLSPKADARLFGKNIPSKKGMS